MRCLMFEFLLFLFLPGFLFLLLLLSRTAASHFHLLWISSDSAKEGVSSGLLAASSSALDLSPTIISASSSPPLPPKRVRPCRLDGNTDDVESTFPWSSESVSERS